MMFYGSEEVVRCAQYDRKQFTHLLLGKHPHLRRLEVTRIVGLLQFLEQLLVDVGKLDFVLGDVA